MSENAITTGIGLRHVRVARRDTDGTIMVLGSPAAGTAYRGIRISGALALSITVPEPQRVTARGDDRPYHTFQLPPTENPTGELRVSKTNLDAVALITSTEEFGSAAARRIGLATDKQGEEETLLVWGCREAIDSEEGSANFGEKCWQTYILLSVQASVRPATFEDAAVGEFVYSLAANQVTLDEFGTAFSTATHGFTKAAVLMVITTYKFMMDAFVGDGVEDEFTLSEAANLQSGGMIQVYVDGSMAAYTESGGVITLTAGAPASGSKIVIQYEYMN
jgi:hypothetical protein